MKKLIALILTLAGMCSLTACGPKTEPTESSSGEEPVEVIVFAAASMEASLDQIAELYKAENPNVSLTFNYDSSGTLRDQIKDGAECNLFISAGQKQMNALDINDTTGKNEDKNDYVEADSRINLVENKVVLAVPESNPSNINTFADLAGDQFSLLCIGNSDVPVGSYSLEILDSLGISIEKLEQDSRVTYATNVTEVATQVKESVVDCGIIYATDAATHGLTVVDQATEEMCSRVVYPAAVIKGGTERASQEAQAFLDYLHTDAEAVAVLEDVGFTVLG